MKLLGNEKSKSIVRCQNRFDDVIMYLGDHGRVPFLDLFNNTAKGDLKEVSFEAKLKSWCKAPPSIGKTRIVADHTIGGIRIIADHKNMKKANFSLSLGGESYYKELRSSKESIRQVSLEEYHNNS